MYMHVCEYEIKCLYFIKNINDLENIFTKNFTFICAPFNYILSYKICLKEKK